VCCSVLQCVAVCRMCRLSGVLRCVAACLWVGEWVGGEGRVRICRAYFWCVMVQLQDEFIEKQQ